MKIVSTTLLACALCFGLSACVPAPSMSKLQKIDAANATTAIVLPESIQYSEKRGIGVLWTFSLAAGHYAPEFEDEKGVFYRGAGKCVTESSPQRVSYAGGVWLSKTGEPPRLYFYFDYDPSTAALAGGLVLSTLFAAEKGNIQYFGKIKNKAFLSHLVPMSVNQPPAISYPKPAS